MRSTRHGSKRQRKKFPFSFSLALRIAPQNFPECPQWCLSCQCFFVHLRVSTTFEKTICSQALILFFLSIFKWAWLITRLQPSWIVLYCRRNLASIFVMVIEWIVIKLRRSFTDPHNVYNRSFRIISKLPVWSGVSYAHKYWAWSACGWFFGRLILASLPGITLLSKFFSLIQNWIVLIVVEISFQMEEITKDSTSGLMTLHTLKNKKDKVALSGYDCVILAIGRVPNTDTLSLDGLVSWKTYK